ncbi:hypothetical protein ACEUAY_02230 [Aeromonas veronii]|uniref:hypothetical protein n=1 Tax=Aeromonas veronii TaxID=654 RepID=UPI00094717CA|nr:hypothetical protein [Aeromonas veronii]MBL0492831.1 hypothetical protein [Aeromonas veronii]OLF59871.1 hypothetical protein BTN33_08815 [Aeromonas veronii]TNJ05658.1 hypothetical protein CF115_15185 [Aeromonas veronii]HDO1377064.1 hypothetical protein [Aeromonas veronii]
MRQWYCLKIDYPQPALDVMQIVQELFDDVWPDGLKHAVVFSRLNDDHDEMSLYFSPETARIAHVVDARPCKQPLIVLQNGFKMVVGDLLTKHRSRDIGNLHQG